MEPQKSELTLDESLKQVMATLPPFIREYLTEEKYTPVARALMAKYKLRIDQGAVLERELMLLLMGIENPTEFTKALAEEARLEQATVNGIVGDVNEQIFIPLRKEEENFTKGAQKTEASSRPAASMPPARSVPPAPVRPVVPPAPHIAPLPPKMAMPKAAGLGDVLRTIMGPKPADPATLLEDHEEPHIGLETPIVPTPSAAKPAEAAPQAWPEPTPTAASLPVTPPAPKAPEAPVKNDVLPPPPPLKVAPLTPPVPPKMPPSPPITSYNSDPYREPIDEK